MNSVTINGKTYTKEFVYDKLSNDAAWIERAIVRLYQRQTEDEKNAHSTNRHNGIGFNQGDAKWLSRFADWLNQGRHLTPKQMAIANKKDKRGIPRVAKYTRQVMEIMATTN